MLQGHHIRSCEPFLDRKNGKVLDRTRTVDNHEFLFCLVVSLGKILNLRKVNNTNIYFVLLLYKGFRPYAIESNAGEPVPCQY